VQPKPEHISTGFAQTETENFQCASCDFLIRSPQLKEKLQTRRSGCKELRLQGIAVMLGFVYVVDDDASFRTAVERRLKQAGFEVVTYPSAQHLLDHMPSEAELGCILLDVRIPGLSGPELQGRLNELGLSLPIVFLTGYPDVPTTVQTIKAGAQDFLTKPVSSDDLLRTVTRAIAHHEVARSLKRKLDIVQARIGKLTPRETEVFDFVIRGKQNKQIANALGTTVRTIKAHRHRVMEKMQVQSVAELVSLAARVGVLGGGAGNEPAGQPSLLTNDARGGDRSRRAYGGPGDAIASDSISTFPENGFVT
jgi:FixJ family two-component response regulator